MFDLHVSELVKTDDDKLIFNAKYRSRPLVKYRRPHGLDNKIFAVACKGDTTPTIVVRGTDILVSKGAIKSTIMIYLMAAFVTSIQMKGFLDWKVW